MTPSAQSDCPATREAVFEQEEIMGEIGCPICGRSAYLHDPEDEDDGCVMCGAHVDAEGACENCWGVDDAR